LAKNTPPSKFILWIGIFLSHKINRHHTYSVCTKEKKVNLIFHDNFPVLCISFNYLGIIHY